MTPGLPDEKFIRNLIARSVGRFIPPSYVSVGTDVCITRLRLDSFASNASPRDHGYLGEYFAGMFEQSKGIWDGMEALLCDRGGVALLAEVFPLSKPRRLPNDVSGAIEFMGSVSL